MLKSTIEHNANILEELASTSQEHISNTQLSKEIGYLFLIKHSINLDHNLLTGYA